MPEPTQMVPSPILVVEDDISLRETIQWTLEDEGWPVESAADGQQALDLASRTRPALIVLDIGLPVVSGQDVAREVASMYDSRPPILVITADGRAATKARQVGAFTYLLKPFALDDLIAAIEIGLGQT
jgi:DNA-binding response OmpR family regulator